MEGGGVELIRAPEGALPGDRVVFEGFEGKRNVIPKRVATSTNVFYPASQPVSQLNPKKKIWETIQPGTFEDRMLWSSLLTIFGTGFITLPEDSNRECAWVDPETKTTHKMIVVGKGVLAAPSFSGASLS